MSTKPNNIQSHRDAKTIDRNNLNMFNDKKFSNGVIKSNNNTNSIEDENKDNKAIDSLKLKNSNMTTSNKDNLSSKPNKKEIGSKPHRESEKEKEKQFFKFQNMSKLIVNKIDDILGAYTNPGYASSSITNYNDTLGLSKNILTNIEANLQIAEENDLLSKFGKNSGKNNSDKTGKLNNISSKKDYNETPMMSGDKNNNLISTVNDNDTRYSNFTSASANFSSNNNKNDNNFTDIKRKKLHSANSQNKIKNNIKQKEKESFYNLNKLNNTNFQNAEKLEKNSREAVNEIVSEMTKEEIEKNIKSKVERRNSKSLNKLGKASKKKKSKKAKQKNDKGVFMTKIDIEGMLNSSSDEGKDAERNKENKIENENEKEPSKPLPYTDINEDDLFDSSDEEIKTNPEIKKEMDDFRYMLMEINGLKKNIQNEFDELQFLIKYVDGTSTRVNRHFNGISNLFKESGLKPKSDKKLYKLKEASDESDDDYNKADNGIYNKEKNMDKIKSNLINLQDNFIGFYKNFDEKMKNIESKNGKFKNMLLYEKNGDVKI